MPATPPPVALRAHTPPTPLHGPRYDNYEPYSPRRSKRSTAQSNPYSSFNGERSPRTQQQNDTTPPATTAKKARFARAPTQLSSPPSSPASPAHLRSSPRQQQFHKTPRKSQTFTPRRPVNGSGSAQSDSDGPLPAAGPVSHSLALPNIDPVTMLPTPSKTPKNKRAQTAATTITSTARILNFQPNNPNDVMPSPQKIRKLKQEGGSRALPHSAQGFELYEDDADDRHGRRGGGRGGDIEIFTDANARVPEMDLSEDNPFVGRKKGRRNEAPRPQKRGRGSKSAEEVERDERIEVAVRQDEGVTYVFRGKKIFRRFEDRTNGDEANDNDATSSVAQSISDISTTPEQRRLKRQAGASAQRPLTRSAIKPRLLFPSEEQIREREERDAAAALEDEEAVTDIEMGNADAEEDAATPVAKDNFAIELATPPTTITKKPAKRASRKKSASTSPRKQSIPEIIEEADEEDSQLPAGYPPASFDSIATSTSTSTGPGKRRSGAKSPFDSWQRTKAESKSGAGKKRAGEPIADVEKGASGAKRTRSAVSSGSPMS